MSFFRERILYTLFVHAPSLWQRPTPNTPSKIRQKTYPLIYKLISVGSCYQAGTFRTTSLTSPRSLSLFTGPTYICALHIEWSHLLKFPECAASKNSITNLGRAPKKLSNRAKAESPRPGRGIPRNEKDSKRDLKRPDPG